MPTPAAALPPRHPRRLALLFPQTLGVRLLVVVINKMDDPTVKWSQERFNECEEKLSPFLKVCRITRVVVIPLAAAHPSLAGA